jgi:predicted acyl esterase
MRASALLMFSLSYAVGNVPHVRLLVLRAALILIASVSILNAQQSDTYRIPTSDGIYLDATVVTPSGIAPAGGFPGVVLVHGYGGSKDDPFMSAIANTLASREYASLAYSVRGQGNSGGLSTTSGPREMADLREVISFFQTVPMINPEKLGVAGGSQGGIHAWYAAMTNIPGVKVVATLVAPPSFAMDLMPNNCIKQQLHFELNLGAVRFAPDRDRIKEFVIADRWDSVLAYSLERDFRPLLDSVRTPVFQSLAWADVLFPANEGIRTVQRLTNRGIPIWSSFGTNGHGEDLNLVEYLSLFDKIFLWFDRWLKDKPLDQFDRPLIVYADDRPDWPHRETIGWPPKPAGSLRLCMSNGALRTVPPNTTEEHPFDLSYDSTYTPRQGWTDGYMGTRFMQAFRGGSARFLSSPFAETLDVAGIPFAHLALRSDAAQFQAHVRLFDVAESDTGFVWRLMTRGPDGIRSSTPGTTIDQEFECQALAHRIVPGNRIGVEVTSLDMYDDTRAHIIPYFSSSASALMISPSDPSYVDIPLIGGATFVAVRQTAFAPPAGFLLHQNYPNPFNPSTVIRFSLAAPAHVCLEVFTVLGQRVASLIDGPLEPGEHQVQFQARGLSSGMYVYRLSVGNRSTERTMLLMR